MLVIIVMGGSSKLPILPPFRLEPRNGVNQVPAQEVGRGSG